MNTECVFSMFGTFSALLVTININFVYSRITLVNPNYEAAPRLFYLKYFQQRYMTCASAAHQENPMGISSSVPCNLCESIKSQRETGLLAYWSTSIYR